MRPIPISVALLLLAACATPKSPDAAAPASPPPSAAEPEPTPEPAAEPAPAPTSDSAAASTAPVDTTPDESASGLATVGNVTPAAGRKRFTASDAAALTNSDLSPGMAWTDAVKKATAKLGKPAFSTTAEGHETVWWTADTKTGCHVVELGRHDQKLDFASDFPFDKGSEGIELKYGKGYVDPCSAKVSATKK